MTRGRKEWSGESCSSSAVESKGCLTATLAPRERAFRSVGIASKFRFRVERYARPRSGVLQQSPPVTQAAPDTPPPQVPYPPAPIWRQDVEQQSLPTWHDVPGGAQHALPTASPLGSG
jgi:hypothetical protein